MPMTSDTWTKSSHSGTNHCLTTRWRKSSYSADTFNCVECSLGPDWKTSPASGGNGCVEAAHQDTVLVRDSKLADSPILSFHPDSWKAFIGGIRAGKMVRPTS